MDETLVYLNVKELREILKDKGLKKKPAPKKREDFERIVHEELSLDHILPFISDSVETKKRLFYENKKNGKCKLLAHTISATIHSLIRYHQYKQLINHGNKYKIEIRSLGCPIEDEFAAKFNKGEIRTLPPFFPGDRNMIIVKPE